MSIEGFAVVAVGGGVVGDDADRARAWLRCAGCGQQYEMALEPVALRLSAAGATVQPGYVEMCPHCFYEHVAGTVLDVEVHPVLFQWVGQ